MSRIIDISQRIYPGMPVWPGDSDFTMEDVMTISPECTVNVSKISLSPHTGTHMDAPYHYDNQGLSAGEVSLTPYIGKVHVVDATMAKGLVEPDHIKDQLPDRCERVILKTTHFVDETSWPTGFTAVHKDAVTMLHQRGVVLIGIDTPSMDPQDSKDLSAHHTIKNHKISILEGVVLNDVEAGVYELIALPLKIAGCDGSPVRAILRTI